MSIKRHYSLPNCALVLEGVGDDTLSMESITERPILSTLVHAECHLIGTEKVLQGGRGFLESLVKAVSAYAQESLSGVHHPRHFSPQEDQIYLEKVQGNLHRLVWKPAPESNQEPLEMELTTVQLFDLIEAVDQFFADSHTLPDLSLTLHPVSRRYRQADEPFLQRLVPFTLGVGSLALAAIAIFMMPIPDVKKPQPRVRNTPTQTAPTPNNPPIPGNNSTPPNSQPR